MNLAQRLDEVALHKAEEEAANQHEQFDDMYNIKEETGRRRSDLFERESKQSKQMHLFSSKFQWKLCSAVMSGKNSNKSYIVCTFFEWGDRNFIRRD